ncbi:tail fiber protein [Paenibacillus hunanensis]|uniref:phage tail protein n=1 Tax=Paenibacillus hunanensis TaxID=539262 RepID=UPI0020272D78|nr:tail fiber protein [Paenibacillus hunanensis]MCL9660733.1 tail fiber protein [Paenibacillus hunanensis]
MDPYIGEIRLFAGSYAPQDWLFCDGTEYSISQYQALFALISTTFGGSVQNKTFKVPDMRGKVPVHRGAGPGLTARNFAVAGGTVNETLAFNQMPSHNHTVQAAASATAMDPTNKTWGSIPRSGTVFAYSKATNAALSPLAIGLSGSGGAHNNMQPFVAINYIICFNGIYPNLNN